MVTRDEVALSRNLSNYFQDLQEHQIEEISIKTIQEETEEKIDKSQEIKTLISLNNFKRPEIIERIGDFRVNKSFVTPHSNGKF